MSRRFRGRPAESGRGTERDMWAVKGKFGEHVGIGLLLLGIAAIETMILAFRYVPDAAGAEISFATGLLTFVFVLTVALPTAVALTLVLRAWRSPRQIRIGSSYVSFDFLRQTREARADLVVAYDTFHSLFAGSSITIRIRRGDSLRVTDLPPEVLGSVVGVLEGANPNLNPEEPWALTQMADGSLVRDRREFMRSESQIETPRGCWCSPTKAARASEWAALPAVAAVLSILPFLVFYGEPDPYAGYGAASVVSAAMCLAVLACALWQAHRVNNGSKGESSLRIETGGPLRTTKAVESAIARIGSVGTRQKDLRIFGVELRRWRIGRDIRVSYLFPRRTDWGRIKMSTSHRRSLEIHQRLKGELLEALRLEGGTMGFAPTSR